MLDRDDNPSIPLDPVRWALVWFAWAGVSLSGIVAPSMLVFGGIPAALACVWVVLGSLNGLRTLRERDVALAGPTSRSLRLLLVVVALASVLGAASAWVPSMGWRAKSGELAYTYSISAVLAPIALASIVGASVRALFSLSTRRIALVVALGVCVWPFLVAIRVLREPLFDIDQQFVWLAPWALHAYATSVAVVGGCAIALMMKTSRLAAAPSDQQPLPKAEITAAS